MASIVSVLSGTAIRIPPPYLPRTAAHIIVALMQPIKRSWIRGVAGMLPIVGLITMLLALGILQFRWSSRVSEAERSRLQQNLQQSTSGFQAAFARDLLRICQTLQAMQPRDPQILVDHLLDRYAVWSRIAGHARLINDLYIWPQSNRQPNTLLRLDPETHALEPVAWPEPLRAFSVQTATHIRALQKRPRGWHWDEQGPTLIHPLYALSKDATGEHPYFFGYLFVVFNTQDFEQMYLPELLRRYFPLSNGFAFQLVAQDGDHERHVVYQSDKHTTAEVFTHADATIPLLDDSMLYRSGKGPAPAEMVPGTSSRVLLSAAGTSKWQIVVRHRSGSVDAAVNYIRRRNLAISIVILLTLLISLITILIATRRARRLAQLQMEFASGVSHELRTPLAVISSAAENLADGVITDSDRVRNYGTLIHKESQRLSGMVDHILDFAHLQAQAHSYQFETVTIANIVAEVLANQHQIIQSAGVNVEVDIPSDLPVLLTDAAALRQCLQNLLSNALKYGSGGRRIVLTASQKRETAEDHILISVQDFGEGIAPEELPHIYEPFYRARGARESQIHGTGLGLSLARKMIEGLGGRITVESSLGKGSTFTLHIPIAPSSDHHAPASEPLRSA